MEAYQTGKFNIGDKVKLSSGGTVMTVHEYGFDRPGLKKTTNHTKLVCTWHDNDGKPQYATYHEDEIKLAK